MKRAFLILFSIALYALSAQASLFVGRGGGATSSSPVGCGSVPGGTPSPDGSCVLPTISGNSQTLLDSSGNAFLFNTNEYFKNGSGVDFATELMINSGGQPYVQKNCNSKPPPPSYLFWFQANTGALTVSPTVALTSKFHNVTHSADYNNMQDMTQAGVLTAGDTLSIDALTGGLPLYMTAGRINKNNLTLNVASGSAIGCMADESNAVITTDTGGGSISSVTLNLNTAEVAWARGGGGDLHCINIGLISSGGSGYTINGGYIHDCDFGIQSPQGTGTGGIITMTGTVLDHNGSAVATAPTHNIYVGTDNANLLLTNVSSYCEGYPAGSFSTSGFEVKTRGPAGTFKGGVAAEVSAHGYTDCFASAAIDMSCGGAFLIGQSGTGNGYVVQVGANMQNTAGAIRYGAEATGGLPNCPTATGWTTNTLAVTHSYIIMDGGISSTKAIYNPNNAAISATVSVSNTIIVCNGSQTCNSTVLGSNVADGGSNTYYTNRAAALAAGQTWATACTGETTTLCPLPAVP